MQFLSLLLIRLIQTFLVIWVVVTIVFVVSRVIGNPEASLLPPFDTTEADFEKVRERLGIDKPIHVQYGIFLKDAVQGNLGYSFVRAGSALDIVGSKIVGTVKLTAAGLVVAIGLGLPLGILAALSRGSPLDWLARLIAVFRTGDAEFLARPDVDFLPRRTG